MVLCGDYWRMKVEGTWDDFVAIRDYYESMNHRIISEVDENHKAIIAMAGMEPLDLNFD